MSYKKYKVKTEILSGFSEGETVCAVDLDGVGFPIIPKEYNGIDKKIIERNPEWFQPVEEYKEGWYNIKRGFQYALINTSGYGFGFDTEWTENFATSIFTKKKHAGVIVEIDKATKNEIEQALIKEAKRRGYRPNVKIKRGQHFSPNSEDTKLTSGYEPEYFPIYDSLDFCGARVYKQGQWAEIIEEPIRIGWHEVEINSDHVKVGCEIVSKEWFVETADICREYNVKMMFEGEDITEQIKQIADRL